MMLGFVIIRSFQLLGEGSMCPVGGMVLTVALYVSFVRGKVMKTKGGASSGTG